MFYFFLYFYKKESISTHTLDLLCSILNCSLEDIAEYKEK
ncbi:MAG TPA: hypothetical protein DCY15_05865 [Ruminococcaceae bacterium]|nr:hypothetical protein [Oscillospiraceae bacterium]